MMHSPRSNKRRMEEMSGQLEPDLDRPAKRMDHGYNVTPPASDNDIMQGEAMMHSSRNNKRNLDEMNEQVGSESDRPAKRLDHGRGVTWADNVDDVMQDEAMVHRPPNNKRRMEEMSGQLEPDLHRPAKRLDHGYNVTPPASDDDIMQDEAMMHSSRNNKRSLDEMNEQVGSESDRPAKRLDHDHGSMSADSDDDIMRDETVIHSSPDDKKKAVSDESDIQFYPVRCKRRYRPNANDDHFIRDEAQPTQGLRGEIPGYLHRVRQYHLLLKTELGDETVVGILNEAYTSDRTTLAIVIHDSPQHVRLWALEILNTMDQEYRRTIIDAMSEIERQRTYNDPLCALPAIMTDSLARNRFGETKTCI
ncbi:hypothetical protein FBEOM_13264, partial [Fusarium beomiforme]